MELRPAIWHKDEISAAFRAMPPEHFRWYRMGDAGAWSPDIEDNDWSRKARAVMDRGNVVGYVSATFDRTSDKITNLAAVRLTPGYNLVFGRGLITFVRQMQNEVASIQFTCVQGNPAAGAWRRLAERAGGRELCILAHYTRIDGVLYHAHMFAIPGREPLP